MAREPSLADTAEEVPRTLAVTAPGFAATVDVYVHSVTDGSIGAVSNADVAKQIQVLNNGFSGQEGGFPTASVRAGRDRPG